MQGHALYPFWEESAHCHFDKVTFCTKLVLEPCTCNTSLYNYYKRLSQKEPNVIFGGRLGEYRYYDMDQVVEASLLRAEKELSE